MKIVSKFFNEIVKYLPLQPYLMPPHNFNPSRSRQPIKQKPNYSNNNQVEMKERPRGIQQDFQRNPTVVKHKSTRNSESNPRNKNQKRIHNGVLREIQE